MHIQRVIRLVEESTKRRYLDSPHFYQKYIVKELYKTLFLTHVNVIFCEHWNTLSRVLDQVMLYKTNYLILLISHTIRASHRLNDKRNTTNRKLPKHQKKSQFFCP